MATGPGSLFTCVPNNIQTPSTQNGQQEHRHTIHLGGGGGEGETGMTDPLGFVDFQVQETSDSVTIH